MNPAIQLLLIQILQTVARLHTVPDYQIISYSMSHVHQVEVFIYPSNARFGGDAARTKPIAHAAAHWHRDRWSYESEYEYQMRCDKWLSELEFMHAALMAYLPIESVEAEVSA